MAGDADTADRKLSDTTETEDYEAADDAEAHHDFNDTPRVTPPMSHVRASVAVGLAITVVLGAVVGWLGFQMYQSHNANVLRELYVQVARQGALNLTTVDWEHADSDVQRILDSATGAFREDFSSRSQAFVDVVKKARSRSVGTIAESGLDSQSGGEAQVLVATRVAISNEGAPEQEPRMWRMRMSVQKVGDEMKISQVAFVP